MYGGKARKDCFWGRGNRNNYNTAAVNEFFLDTLLGLESKISTSTSTSTITGSSTSSTSSTGSIFPTLQIIDAFETALPRLTRSRKVRLAYVRMFGVCAYVRA